MSPALPLILLLHLSPPATTQTKPFQAGISIDWQAPAVIVDTHVILRDGPLEFLACRPGKEHESILSLDASATHLFQALGLIGLTPGHPPRWNPERNAYDDPAGDLLDITLRWQADRQTHHASPFDWLTEVSFGRTPIQRPWVFAGSLRTPEHTLAADHTGTAIALVDFPDSLICYSRRFPSRYGALWAAPRTSAIPPVGTPVDLIITPAAQISLAITLDHRGLLSVNGRYCTPPDLLNLVKLAHRLAPDKPLKITAAGALEADRRDLTRRLRNNLPQLQINWLTTPPTTTSPGAE